MILHLPASSSKGQSQSRALAAALGMRIACSHTEPLSCSAFKMPERVNLKLIKVYFDSQFLRCQSIITWPCSLHLVATQYAMIGLFGEEPAYLLVAGKQRKKNIERGWNSSITFKDHRLLAKSFTQWRHLIQTAEANQLTSVSKGRLSPPTPQYLLATISKIITVVVKAGSGEAQCD